jgi:hypothetical protein
LAYFEAEGEAFLSCIVAADETCGHEMEWNHSQSPYKKKLENTPAGKS